MELNTLILTIAIIFPLFIQFHYLLVNPWKLCRAFHYYSGKSRRRITEKPRLILHYPKLHPYDFASNSVNSMNSVSHANIKNDASKLRDQKVSTLEKTSDSNSLKLSTSSIETVNEIHAVKNNSCPRNFGKNVEKRINSHTPVMLNFSKPSSTNLKDVNVKSGCTDFFQEELTPESNAQVEYLYSRDLFLFEYRKRPNVKSEGTQSDNRKTGNSRIFRF